MYAFVTTCNRKKRTKNDNTPLNIYYSHLVALSEFKQFVTSYSALTHVYRDDCGSIWTCLTPETSYCGGIPPKRSLFAAHLCRYKQNHKPRTRRCRACGAQVPILRQRQNRRIPNIEEAHSEKRLTHIAETIVRQGVRTVNGLKPLVGALLQPSGLEQQLGQFLRRTHYRIVPGLDREVFPSGVKLDAPLGAVEFRVEGLDAVDAGARQELDAASCAEVGQALR